MPFLANILQWLVGKGLGGFTVPMMALGLLITAHQLIKKDREEKVQKIETAAAAQCQQSWMVAVSKSRERSALARAEEAQGLIQAERRINEGLTNDLESLRQEMEQVRIAARGNDERCLSDSVLDALRRRQDVGSKGRVGKEGSSSAPSQ